MVPRCTCQNSCGVELGDELLERRAQQQFGVTRERQRYLSADCRQQTSSTATIRPFVRPARATSSMAPVWPAPPSRCCRRTPADRLNRRARCPLRRARFLQPFVGNRLQQVNRPPPGSEGLHRVLVVGGDEDDAAVARCRVRHFRPLRPGMRMSRNATAGSCSASAAVAASPSCVRRRRFRVPATVGAGDVAGRRRDGFRLRR